MRGKCDFWLDITTAYTYTSLKLQKDNGDK